jgi:hypothetical protein
MSFASILSGMSRWSLLSWRSQGAIRGKGRSG